jgi:hypothetical protein
MMGRAIGYLRGNAMALTRFLEDGRIPIDNGAVERLHVRTALTRNYAEPRIMRSGSASRCPSHESRSGPGGSRRVSGATHSP